MCKSRRVPLCPANEMQYRASQFDPRAQFEVVPGGHPTQAVGATAVRMEASTWSPAHAIDGILRSSS